MSEDEMMHWTRRRLARIKWEKEKHKNEIRFQRFNCVLILISMIIVWRWLGSWWYGMVFIPAMMIPFNMLFSDTVYGE
jgi:fatty acid desaturase